MSSICKEMASHMFQHREYEKAITCYKEALSHAESDGKVCVVMRSIHNRNASDIVCIYDFKAWEIDWSVLKKL